MLAVSAAEPPSGDGWTFEPKYDGIRVLAIAHAGDVAMMSRNGLDKSAQFPEIVEAVAAIASRTGGSIVLDGEIVAVVDGEPARFQSLQSRMHATHGIERHREATPAALVAFDCLLIGDTILLGEPWTRRRKALEKALRARSEHVVLGGSSPDGEATLREARARGWEGVIAKRVDRPYRAGERSRDWLKLKLERRQEFVVGGYTTPRGSRTHLGALLVGHFEGGNLAYAGKVGGGFSRASLSDMERRLKPLVRPTPPFRTPPKVSESPVWVEPRVVVEVRFNEWTGNGKLRQPIFLGVREDKDARSVVRESSPIVEPETVVKPKITRPAASSSGDDHLFRIVARLDEIEKSGGEGVLDLGREGRLELTSLGKLFFPRARRTKGDLMRYYTRISPALLPAMRDRPLVLKRFPNGVGGQAFYQQRAPDRLPPGVRAEPVADDGELRLVGGTLITLLYTVQLGAISVDPWHARVHSLDTPDYAIIDLDPGPGATFRKVVRVALLVREELARHGLRAIPKTSGASGMHIAIPLPRGVDERSARLLAELVATNVAAASPKIATVMRAVRARPRGTVYVDFLQNIRGKSVAGVYSVRAEPLATVSTPLEWDEVDESLDPRAFTMDAVARRFATLGDLWAAGMKASNSLRALAADRQGASRRAASPRSAASRPRRTANA